MEGGCRGLSSRGASPSVPGGQSRQTHEPMPVPRRWAEPPQRRATRGAGRARTPTTPRPTLGRRAAAIGSRPWATAPRVLARHRRTLSRRGHPLGPRVQPRLWPRASRRGWSAAQAPCPRKATARQEARDDPSETWWCVRSSGPWGLPRSAESMWPWTPGPPLPKGDPATPREGRPRRGTPARPGNPTERRPGAVDSRSARPRETDRSSACSEAAEPGAVGEPPDAVEAAPDAAAGAPRARGRLGAAPHRTRSKRARRGWSPETSARTSGSAS